MADRSEIRADVDRPTLAALDYLARMEHRPLADLCREALVDLLRRRHEAGHLPAGLMPPTPEVPRG